MVRAKRIEWVGNDGYVMGRLVAQINLTVGGGFPYSLKMNAHCLPPDDRKGYDSRTRENATNGKKFCQERLDLYVSQMAEEVEPEETEERRDE